MKYILGLAVILFLTSCASLNLEQCQTANWYDIGRKDGQQGYETNRVDAHVSACEKHNITIDKTQYKKGFLDGNALYCTYENGVQIGSAGKGYKNVCSGHAHDEFYSGYIAYYNVENTRKNISILNSSIQTAKNKLRDKDTDKIEAAGIKVDIATDRVKLESSKRDLLTYEYELLVHRIDRQIYVLTQELKNPELSEIEKTEKNEKISELRRQRKLENRSYKAKKTVKSLKNIKSLFN